MFVAKTFHDMIISGLGEKFVRGTIFHIHNEILQVNLEREVVEFIHGTLLQIETLGKNPYSALLIRFAKMDSKTKS